MGQKSLRLESVSKADQKFEKKLQFYAKVRDSVVSLAANKLKRKRKKSQQRLEKLKAYDLSSLLEFLPQLEAPKEAIPADFKLNCKSRQQLILKEAKQLSTVLNHPVFQVDPQAAIQHLDSTQPLSDEKQKKKKGKNGGKKTKKKPKDFSGPQSMEI